MVLGLKFLFIKKNNIIGSSADDISQHPNLVTSEFHFWKLQEHYLNDQGVIKYQ